jgi:hypothetical protein
MISIMCMVSLNICLAQCRTAAAQSLRVVAAAEAGRRQLAVGAATACVWARPPPNLQEQQQEAGVPGPC